MRDREVGILNTLFILDEENRMVYNGADRYLVNLFALLTELGYEPRVWQASERTHEYEKMRVEGLPWGPIEYGTVPELNLQFFERTVGCDRTIYLAPPLAFPRLRPRSVVVSHGVFWDYPSQPWAALSGPLKQEWLRRLHHAVTAPDLFVSVDTATLNWIRATWPGYGSRQVYIPNFVDLDLFHPAEEAREQVVILYPRRLDPGRGIDEARIAARTLTRRYDFVEFHFVGRGVNDSVEAEIWQWTAENPRCRYCWAAMEEMPQVYRQADIVVIPTKSCEGTSLSCLEAMASGKAVVCGRVGGLTDLVIDRLNGRLIDVTPEALTEALDELVRHPEERRRLGAKARETAASFSLLRWKRRWNQALRAVWGDPE